MAAINPTSGVGSSAFSPIASRFKTQQQPEKAGFGQVLKNFVSNVNADQKVSSEAITNLLTGKTNDILPVVSAVAKADMSFKLLMGVRNKVIEAYKQTMNMQV